jgi:hypothetical protein
MARTAVVPEAAPVGALSAPTAHIVDSSEILPCTMASDPFLNAQIHAVITFFVSNVCDDAIFQRSHRSSSSAKPTREMRQ